MHLSDSIQNLANRVEVIEHSESPRLANPYPGSLSRTVIGGPPICPTTEVHPSEFARTDLCLVNRELASDVLALRWSKRLQVWLARLYKANHDNHLVSAPPTTYPSWNKRIVNQAEPEVSVELAPQPSSETVNLSQQNNTSGCHLGKGRPGVGCTAFPRIGCGHMPNTSVAGSNLSPDRAIVILLYRPLKSVMGSQSIRRLWPESLTIPFI